MQFLTIARRCGIKNADILVTAGLMSSLIRGNEGFTVVCDIRCKLTDGQRVREICMQIDLAQHCRSGKFTHLDSRSDRAGPASDEGGVFKSSPTS